MRGKFLNNKLKNTVSHADAALTRRRFHPLSAWSLLSARDCAQRCATEEQLDRGRTPLGPDSKQTLGKGSNVNTFSKLPGNFWRGCSQ